MLEYTAADLTVEQANEMRTAYEPLAQSVRDLIDAAIRSETDAATVAIAKAEIDSATRRLRSRQLKGAFGAQRIIDGGLLSWGNAVTGIRNPVAPPLVINRDPGGRVWADVTLGAAYEGPPGHVHGGIGALILDHLLGEAASSPSNPRFTGTISLRYVRAMRLGTLRAEATVARTEGVKTFAVGSLADDAGVTIEAEGVFIQPRWARG